MMKKLLTLFSVLLMSVPVTYAYQLDHVSVHDPSVVWEPTSKYYYIFGSHHAAARTKDMMSWTSTNWSWSRLNDAGGVVSGATNDMAFVNGATKTITKNGVEVDFCKFNAHDWSAAYGNYSVGGNMWAPDVIYN